MVTSEEFEQFVEQERDNLIRYAVSIVGLERAEDLVQTSMMKAWSALPRFEGKSTLKTWLWRIIHNEGLMVLRGGPNKYEVQAPEIIYIPYNERLDFWILLRETLDAARLLLTPVKCGELKRLLDGHESGKRFQKTRYHRAIKELKAALA